MGIGSYIVGGIVIAAFVVMTCVVLCPVIATAATMYVSAGVGASALAAVKSAGAALNDQPSTSTVRPAANAGTPLSRVDRAGSALKDDPFHRSVSWVVDNPAAQRFSVTGGDGVQRQLYQLLGELNGKPGAFEWMVGRSGSTPVITHQRFIPGGGVTGSPNQVP